MFSDGLVLKKILHKAAKLSLALSTCVTLFSSGNVSAGESPMQWQTNSISYLHGNDYEVGKKVRSIVTWEHFSGWNYGDLFIFVDVSDPANQQQKTYGEIHPRLSFGKISGDPDKFNFGLLKDVLLAGEFEFGSKKHRAYLYGLGFDFDLPKFKYFSVNLYMRDQIDYEGRTYQISPYWALPFKVGGAKLSLEGFADFDGGEDTRKASALIVPQLMLDVGHFWGEDDKIMVGTEWQYWNNKFGIDGVTESVFQFLVKVKF